MRQKRDRKKVRGDQNERSLHYSPGTRAPVQGPYKTAETCLSFFVSSVLLSSLLTLHGQGFSFPL